MKVINFQLKVLGLSDLTELEKRTAELTRTKLDLRKEIQAINKAYKDSEVTDAKKISLSKEMATAQGKLKDNTKRLVAAEKLRVITSGKVIHTTKKEIGAYRKLSAQEADNARQIKDLLAAKAQGIVLDKQQVIQLNRLIAVQKQQIATLKGIDVQMGRSQRNVGNYTSVFKNAGKSMLSFLGAGGAVMAGITLITAAFRKFSEAKDIIVAFDESVADVSKTTNSTIEEARTLSVELSKLDTRTSVTELLKLATAGGRMGLEMHEVAGFVREADKVFVALGDSLDGDAEQIALKMAKIAQSMGLVEEYGIAEAINKVGSVFNELGATTEAQEGPMLDMTNRMIGLGKEAGLTFPQIAAMASTMDAGAQSMEIAATTLQRVIPSLADNAVRFAKIADLGDSPSESLEKFTELLEDDAYGALISVAKGAKSTKSGLLALQDVLESFDIESARGTQIVTFLTASLAELDVNLKTAEGQMRKNTSVNAEAAKKQNTLAAKAEKTDNKYKALILSMDDGNGIISDSVIWWEELKGEFYDLSAALNDGEISWRGWLGAITDSNVKESIFENKKEIDRYKDGLRDLVKISGDASLPEALDILRQKMIDNSLSFDDATENVLEFRAELEKMAIVANKEKKKKKEEAGTPSQSDIAKAFVAGLDKQAASYQRLTWQINETEKAMEEVNSKDPEFKIYNEELKSLKERLKNAKDAFMALHDEQKRLVEFNKLGFDATDSIWDAEYDVLIAEWSLGIGDLIEKQEQLNKELAKTSVGSQEYNKITKELAEVKKAYDEIDVEGQIEAYTYLIDKQDRLVESLSKVEQGTDEFKKLTKELEATKKAYDIMDPDGIFSDGFFGTKDGLLKLDVTNKDKESIKEKTERLLQVEFDTIEAFYKDKENVLQSDFLKILQGGDPKEVKAATKKLTEDMLNAQIAKLKELRGANQGSGSVDTADTERDLLGQQTGLEQDLAGLGVDQQSEDDKAAADKEAEKRKAIKDAAIQGARDLVDSFADIEIERIDRIKDRQLSALDEEYDERIRKAKGNAQLIANLEKQKAKEKLAIEKKAAKAKHRIRMMEAIAEIALSIIEAAPEFDKIGATIALGATQLAIVAAQKFEKGGRIDKNGNIIGPSHSAGGIQYGNIEVEGGERRDIDEYGNTNIINKRSNAAFSPLLDTLQGSVFAGKGKVLSRINSYNGYGVPLAEDGALISRGRPGASIPRGIRQIVVATQSNGTQVRDVVRELIPELSRAVRDGATAGSAKGSMEGAKEGSKQGLIRATEINEDRLILQDRRTA